MRALITVILLFSTPLQAQDGTALNSGDSVIFEVPQASAGAIVVSESFFIDVPAGARDLFVELDTQATRDFDIIVRPDVAFPMAGTAANLFAQADFSSASSLPTEHVHVQDFATEQLPSRRWFVAVMGFAGAAADVTLSVTTSNRPPPRAEVRVDFTNATGANDCDTAFWNDSSPFTAEGGNNAGTVGEARRAAMLRAADELASELTSRVPITIRACWADRGEANENGGITLAAARTNFLAINTPGLPRDRAYSQAAGTRLGGTEACRLFGGDDCDEQEVIIFFNIHAANRYYYGFQPSVTGDGTDFISVAMHEITHGLGYFELSNEQGALPVFGGQRVSDAYLHQLTTVRSDGSLVRLDDPSVNDAERAAAFVSFDNLLWADDQVNISEDNILLSFASRFGLTRMEAPAQFSGGSSVSHISGAYCDIMRPSFGLCQQSALRDLNLSRKVLHGVGWHDRPGRAQYIGLYYDRSREGHGFDLQIGGVDPEGRPIYVLTFYSYETLGGAPEWFQAIGIIENGAFVPLRNGDMNGMPQYFYQEGRIPPQQADSRFAQVALSFNDPATSPACTDGVQRPGAEFRSSFQWAIDNLVGEWCAEPLIPSSALPRAQDFGGLWFVGADDEGWGFSLENIRRGDGSVDVFVLLYVYAADGTPVWFFGQAPGFVPGQPLTLTMFQRTGYNRRANNGQLRDEEAGTMVLTLSDPHRRDANSVTVDVTYLGNEGGGWLRNEVPVQRLSVGRFGD